MDLLKINNQTFYRLKGELYQEAREIWRQTYKESQVYRIIHTINSINLALRTNKEIILDKTQSAKDRLEACDKLVELEMNFLKLVSEINDDDTTERPTLSPAPTYPTITDPSNPEKLICDPKWIEDNARKVRGEYK